MNHLVAARCEGAALLRGRLPALVGERFWGKRVLVPAGRRPDPAVGEDVLAAALRLGEDVALLTDAGADVFPRDAFGPVSRAAVRLALEAEHAR
jgi:hypothetical protein